MSFDPYFHLLGIPREEQPPTYYRLLGLPTFEPNPATIHNSAVALVTYLRSLQTGPYAAPAAALATEVETARRVLTDPNQKLNYDRHLLSRPLGPPPVATVPVATVPVAAAAPLPVARPQYNAPPPPASTPLPPNRPVTSRPATPRPSATVTPLFGLSLQMLQILLGAGGGLAMGVLFVWLVFRSDPLGLFKDKPKPQPQIAELVEDPPPKVTPPKVTPPKVTPPKVSPQPPKAQPQPYNPPPQQLPPPPPSTPSKPPQPSPPSVQPPPATPPPAGAKNPNTLTLGPDDYFDVLREIRRTEGDKESYDIAAKRYTDKYSTTTETFRSFSRGEEWFTSPTSSLRVLPTGITPSQNGYRIRLGVSRVDSKTAGRQCSLALILHAPDGPFRLVIDECAADTKNQKWYRTYLASKQVSDVRSAPGFVEVSSPRLPELRDKQALPNLQCDVKHDRTRQTTNVRLMIDNQLILHEDVLTSMIVDGPKPYPSMLALESKYAACRVDIWQIMRPGADGVNVINGPPGIAKPPPPSTPEIESPPEVVETRVRVEPPAAEQQAQILADLKAKYRESFEAATTPAERQRLATQLLESADRELNDNAVRFTLLHEAYQIYVTDKDFTAAAKLIDRLEREYTVDEFKFRGDFAARLAEGSKTPAERMTAHRFALETVDSAVRQRRYAEALQLVRTAETVARFVGGEREVDKSKRRLKTIEGLADQYAPIREARDGAAPAGFDLRFEEGKFACLTEGDWETGLSLLSGCKYPDLAAAAGKDLDRSNGLTPEQMGDVWYTLGKRDSKLTAFLSRSAYWYRRSKSVGLERHRMDQRIREVDELGFARVAPPASVKLVKCETLATHDGPGLPVDLLYLIEQFGGKGAAGTYGAFADSYAKRASTAKTVRTYSRGADGVYQCLGGGISFFPATFAVPVDTYRLRLGVSCREAPTSAKANREFSFALRLPSASGPFTVVLDDLAPTGELRTYFVTRLVDEPEKSFGFAVQAARLIPAVKPGGERVRGNVVCDVSPQRFKLFVDDVEVWNAPLDGPRVAESVSDSDRRLPAVVTTGSTYRVDHWDLTLPVQAASSTAKAVSPPSGSPGNAATERVCFLTSARSLAYVHNANSNEWVEMRVGTGKVERVFREVRRSAAKIEIRGTFKTGVVNIALTETAAEVSEGNNESRRAGGWRPSSDDLVTRLLNQLQK